MTACQPCGIVLRCSQASSTAASTAHSCRSKITNCAYQMPAEMPTLRGVLTLAVFGHFAELHKCNGVPTKWDHAQMLARAVADSSGGGAGAPAGKRDMPEVCGALAVVVLWQFAKQRKCDSVPAKWVMPRCSQAPSSQRARCRWRCWSGARPILQATKPAVCRLPALAVLVLSTVMRKCASVLANAGCQCARKDRRRPQWVQMQVPLCQGHDQFSNRQMPGQRARRACSGAVFGPYAELLKQAQQHANQVESC